jgi:hypothetical protein
VRKSSRPCDLSISDDLVAAMTRQSDLLRARVEQGSTPLERNMVEVELRRLEAERLPAGRWIASSSS